MRKYPVTYYPKHGPRRRAEQEGESMEGALAEFKRLNPESHGVCIYNPDHLDKAFCNPCPDYVKQHSD